MNMKIIAHRGYWKDKKDRNTINAFKAAFDRCYGVETDIRDHNGIAVISHDPAIGNEITLEDFLKLLNGRNLPLALNIKADGLGSQIKELLNKYNITNYFTFDMSIPELIQELDIGLNVFTGYSDIQPYPVRLQQSKGVWLDCFFKKYIERKDINVILNQNKQVCIVSPDMHNRQVKYAWKEYKDLDCMICTDIPDEARDYFD